MTTDETQPNSVREYFETQVYPEDTAAIKAKEDKKKLHDFVGDSGRHHRREERERQNKIKTEPMQTKWDCGCITTFNPDGTILRSPCGSDDCLYDRGMARTVK